MINITYNMLYVSYQHYYAQINYLSRFLTISYIIYYIVLLI